MTADRRRESIDDLDALLASLPPEIVDAVHALPEKEALIEVVLDLGRRPEARFPDSRGHPARPRGHRGRHRLRRRPHRHVRRRQPGGDRADPAPRSPRSATGTGKIVGLTCRIGRAVYGTIEIIHDFVETGKSILILGRPGIGKTTMLREAARVLADEHGKRVVIVDTSNEIAGDGDIPHPAIGKARRMQVRTPSLQHEVMIEAVENHMPQVIVIDEIGTELEAAGRPDDRRARRPADRHGPRQQPRQPDAQPDPVRPDRRDPERHPRRRGGPPAADPEERPRAQGAADVRRDHRDPGPRAGRRPRRRRRHGRRDAPRRCGRARAALARRGGRPPLAGPAAAVAARADRRRAVRRPRRVRPAVADGARLARRGLVPRRLSRRGCRRSAAPVGLPARRERRLAPDPGRHVPRAGRRAARSPTAVHPPPASFRASGSRSRRPAGAARDSTMPAFVSGEIADRGPLERGAPPVPDTRARDARELDRQKAWRDQAARALDRPPGGGGDRAGQRRRPRRSTTRTTARSGSPRAESGEGVPRARRRRRCRRSGSCPRGSAGSASSRRSATSSCRSRSPATSTRRTS